MNGQSSDNISSDSGVGCDGLSAMGFSQSQYETPYSQVPELRDLVLQDVRMHERQSRTRSRAFSFTIFGEALEDTREELLVLLGRQAYAICGLENCRTTGRAHIQGYVRFPNARSLATVRVLLGPCHVEVSKGDARQNIVYCSKEGNWKEVGERPLSANEKGVREQERWRLARHSILLGDMEGVPDDIFIRHYGNLRAIIKDYAKDVDDYKEETGLWIYGPAGCGKSRYARANYPDSYLKPANKWWDGYNGQKSVILDDWDPSHSKFLTYHLKMWSDRYAFTAEIKGGAIKIRPDVFIVTSQYSIEECFEDCASRDAIRRRFKVIPPAYFTSE